MKQFQTQQGRSKQLSQISVKFVQQISTTCGDVAIDMLRPMQSNWKVTVLYEKAKTRFEVSLVFETMNIARFHFLNLQTEVL